MGRREQREQIFKLLFRVEFNELEEMPQQRDLFLDEIKLPVEEDGLAAREKDLSYIAEKYGRIQEKLSEIDRLINEKTEGWSLGRMGKVEVTLLRLGAYEILFDQDVPDSVAINEAVELAKRYGQDNSGSFVNAVLAKFLSPGQGEKQ
ncbi:transcription antitermination protein NusB [Lachnospiraceae bacterium]|jgi:N utilization substance protein B|nr:transcription antitermination factor NusB [Lachnospiraceae bacterium]MCX4272818.1 transcription antitermination factor NusB [Acetatifactor sp.]GFH94369.1 transcription antitermination protein NusB [Lachnospiraceae bacterium]